MALGLFNIGGGLRAGGWTALLFGRLYQRCEGSLERGPVRGQRVLGAWLWFSDRRRDATRPSYSMAEGRFLAGPALCHTTNFDLKSGKTTR